MVMELETLAMREFYDEVAVLVEECKAAGSLDWAVSEATFFEELARIRG